MVETKYGKYFITYDPSRWQLGNVPFRMIARLDDSVVKGSYYYHVQWELPSTTPHVPVGHPPHIHKDAELLFHIGTNPDDPTDLGAEVEIFMGKELERHVITKSTVIYIPPNFIHCPWRPLRTDRAWIFIQVNQGPFHTEKTYLQLLPKELRDKQDFSRFKDKGF